MKFKSSIASVVLVIGSIVCFFWSGYLIYERFIPVSVAFTSSPKTIENSSLDTPQIIEIPSTGIRLPITILDKNGDWPISKNSVVHLRNTSVFYAHNWPNLLGSLHKVAPHDTVLIHITEKKVRKYKVQSVQSVWPNQNGVLQVNDDQIVIYTCAGFLDSKRLVVVATFLN